MAIAGTSSDADSGRMRNKVGEDGGGTAIWVVDRVFTVDGIAVGVLLIVQIIITPSPVPLLNDYYHMM